MQRTEAALEQGNSHVGPLPSMSKSQPSSSMIFNSNAMETNADLSVVPSIKFFRSSESIKCEVEQCLAELHTLNETASKGKVKSQCEGHGDIFVKKSVYWPQNFI